MPITDAQRAGFRTTGIIRLERGVPRAVAERAKEAIEAGLARIDTKRIKALPLFQQVGVLGGKVGTGAWLADLFPPTLAGHARELGGARLKAAAPQLLLSLPQKTAWSLDDANWHLDLKVPERDEVPGVQAFVLVDDVAPRGGATLAIAGSHRLHHLPEARDGGAHAFLRRGELVPEVGKTRSLHGVDVSVVEMSGRAGDVYFMDLRVLHAPSVNAAKSIRMMATVRYLPT